MKHHAAHHFSSDCFSVDATHKQKSEVLNSKIRSVLESRHVSGESRAYLLSSEKSDVKCICDFPLS